MQRSTGIRVLFAGQYWPGANTVYIAKAFERCGAIVRVLNDTTLLPGWTGFRGKVVRRLVRRVVIEREWNEQLLELVDNFTPDLVYVTNADLCAPRTLWLIRGKGVPVMCFYHDVQWDRRAGSRFSENLPHFDLVATTRRWQEPLFRAAGAPAVMVVRFGFEPLVHRPIAVDDRAHGRYGADISFIGTYENHRATELSEIVSRDFPYSFRLWGGFWDTLPSDSKLRGFWQRRHVQEQEIPVIYAATKIALHWVGWEPKGRDPALRIGDQHNSRTFQIAACGGAMMMAQRTDEHVELFCEDKEAVYFDSIEELRDKLAYWLSPARDDLRRSIAAAARGRCVSEDYSYVPVARRFLRHFGLPVVDAP